MLRSLYAEAALKPCVERGVGAAQRPQHRRRGQQRHDRVVERWHMVEQRIRHAENQLAVAGRG